MKKDELLNVEKNHEITESSRLDKQQSSPQFNVLKFLRESVDLSVEELSQRLDIPEKYIEMIENNEKYPSVELLKRYCDVFGISLRTLVLLEDDSKECGWSYQQLLVELLKIFKEKAQENPKILQHVKK